MHTVAGHRQRVKNRFRKEGLDSFDEVHALELLLFYVIPQRDTKPLARTLLDRFGSLPLVLEATADELMKVPGVGENVATFLNLVLASGRYYAIRKSEEPVFLNTIQECGEYLVSHFMGMRNEAVYLLCLDAKCKALCCLKLAEGDVNSANVPLRRVVEVALGTNATSVILAHNHPSGMAVPSLEDVRTTERIAGALGAMDIALVDHIVVADKDFTSFVHSRLYDPSRFCEI